MGLDMYAFSVERDETRPATDFDRNLPNARELQYWRKHPNLHGWMKALYKEKGGLNDEFNLDAVLLEPKDIDRLEESVLGNALPETDGFFFGESTIEDKINDLDFIAKAREAFAQHKQVFYYAWW